MAVTVQVGANQYTTPHWLGNTNYQVGAFWYYILPWMIPVYYFPTNRGRTFDHDYYFDIPDYQNETTIQSAGWVTSITFDTPISWGPKNYTTDSGVQNYEVNIGGNYHRYSVDTTYLDRVNTIVVHENGSLDEGHFSDLKRFNVIMLDVQASSEVFDSGLNVILVPVETFLQSEMHVLMEHANATNQLPACLQGAEFLGLDLDQNRIINMSKARSRKEAFLLPTLKRFLTWF